MFIKIPADVSYFAFNRQLWTSSWIYWFWRCCYLQQGDTRVHASVETISFLREFFDNTDFSIPLFATAAGSYTARCILVGYLKDQVFVIGPATIKELKQRVTADEINAIPRAVLHRIFWNMLKQLRLCKRKQRVTCSAFIVTININFHAAMCIFYLWVSLLLTHPVYIVSCMRWCLGVGCKDLWLRN